MLLLGEASPAHTGWGFFLLLWRGTVSLNPNYQPVQQQEEMYFVWKSKAPKQIAGHVKMLTVSAADDFSKEITRGWQTVQPSLPLSTSLLFLHMSQTLLLLPYTNPSPLKSSNDSLHSQPLTTSSCPITITKWCNPSPGMPPGTEAASHRVNPRFHLLCRHCWCIFWQQPGVTGLSKHHQTLRQISNNPSITFS